MPRPQRTTSGSSLLFTMSISRRNLRLRRFHPFTEPVVCRGSKTLQRRPVEARGSPELTRRRECPESEPAPAQPERRPTFEFLPSAAIPVCIPLDHGTPRAKHARHPQVSLSFRQEMAARRPFQPERCRSVSEPTPAAIPTAPAEQGNDKNDDEDCC